MNKSLEPRVVADLSRYGHDGLLRGDAHVASAHAVQLAATELIQGKAADLLILALRHRDSSVRRHAAQALDKVARSDFNRVMAVALQHQDTQVRHRAAESLADADLVGLREETLDHALVMALNHWDAAVRRSAVDALGRLPLADATEAMKVAVGRRDTVVQRRATDFLGRDELASVAVELAPPDGPVGLADRQVAEGQLVPEDYSGWERRWDLALTNYWNLEPEGLRGRYNRVEGGYLAWFLPRVYHRGSGLAKYGEVGYSLGQRQYSYRAGVEGFSFYKLANSNGNLVSVGGELHDLTYSQDGWLITEEENSLDAAMFRRDYRDYYRRSGWSV